MNMSKLAQYVVKQSLGTKRGQAVIDLLSGPVGQFLDLALGGKGSEALAKLDDAVADLRGLLS